MWIVETRRTDVYRNLAVEEYLLGAASEGPHLFLCRNEPAVVIGKNQNPWKECRLDRLRAAGATLARRISGGGAVYHDLGNLNYSLIYPRAAYRADEAFSLALSALKRLGVDARLERKNMLTAAGRKVSGHAFAFRGNGVLHHGTLLVSTDLDRLQSLFPGDLVVEDTHAVASVPAATGNLSELRPGLGVRDVADVLAEQFRCRYGPATRLDDTEIERWDYRAIRERLGSKAWRYDRTPPFTVVLTSGWRLRVEEGVVRSVWKTGSNAGEGKTIGDAGSWIGRSFQEIEAEWRRV